MSDHSTQLVSDPMPQIFTASRMQAPKPIEWLAKSRLALAVITVLIGDEGIGKSLFWVWLARYITTGTACPEYGIKAGEPQHIVLLLAENGFIDMDRPRLEAAGVNLDYVHVIATHDDGSGAPAFTQYTRSLIDNLAADGITPALFIADPWLDTVPADLNVRDGQQAKRALRPWRELAVQHNAAVLLVAHTNRMSTGNARDKYGATAELRKTARMTLFAQVDDETGLLSIGPEKSNLTPRDVKASQFKISTVERHGWEDGIPVLEYMGDAEYTSHELIETKFEADSGIGDSEDRNEAETFLLDLMKSQPVKSVDVFREATKLGISKDQAKRAKKKLKIISKKSDDAWVRVTKDFQESSQGGITLEPAPLLPCSLAPLQDNRGTS